MGKHSFHVDSDGKSTKSFQKKKAVKSKKSSFEKGVEIMCEKFDNASKNEIDW